MHTCDMILCMYGAKPKSNIRSASSSTKYDVRPNKFVWPPFIKSSKRPGVALFQKMYQKKLNATHWGILLRLHTD